MRDLGNNNKVGAGRTVRRGPRCGHPMARITIRMCNMIILHAVNQLVVLCEEAP
jgi:hypothetical protein